MSELLSARSARPGWLAGGILLLLLLAGFGLRVWHVDWADGQLPHPDERSTVAFYAPSIRWPPEGISPLDTRQSPLNPLWDVHRQERRSYTYGHFPLYSLVLIANAVHALAPVAERLGASPELVETLRTANGVPGFALVGRVLMAVADTATVLLVYLLADRIYGRNPRRRWVGLLAAAFSTFTVLQIQLSHFFAVDPVSTTFTGLALYGALRMLQDRSWGWSLVTGLGAGLAIASKFSALPILAAPVVAGVLLAWRQRRAGQAGIGLGKIVGLVAVALLVAVTAFAVTSPFAILDWQNFQRAVIVEQGAMVRGDADFPFTRQYRGTLPYIYQIEQQIRWGIGWPLGLLAFGSLLWVLARLVSGRARDGELIILSWLVAYFGLTGLFLAKFMRYMVPVVPFLMVFAAGLIAALWARGSSTSDASLEARETPSPAAPVLHSAFRIPRFALRGLAAALAVFALLGAILWSLAYVNGVYNNTHPWIKASRWMYATIPDGSTIAWEQWDDSLPYDLPEANASRSRYRFVDWGPFEEDSAEKFELLKRTLREADYLALASNRVYGAVDNLPARYPMTNRYYQLLFDEQLGFELALEQVNHPSLVGIGVDDSGADESFTLYDHPRVLIFRKVRDLTDAEWHQLLGGSWEGAKPWYVGEPILLQRLWSTFGLEEAAASSHQEPGPGEGASLLLDQRLDQLPVLDDFRWNALASQSVPVAVVVFWLVLFVVGLLAWPIAFALFRSLADRGYLLARCLGLLLLGYPVWLLASLRLGQNSLSTILAVLVGLGLVSLLVWWLQRRAMAEFWRGQRRLLVGEELLFAAAYLLFVLFRIANPDLWQPWNGGEKFMEFAFLNAILRSPYFPPVDPYFAGGTINYYYYGHYLVNLLIKLTGIWSSVAFNLAIPALFALTVGNVFSLAYSLAGGEDGARRRGGEGARSVYRPVAPALLAAFFVALLGNVDGGGQLVRKLAELSPSAFASNLPGLQTAVRAIGGLAEVAGPVSLPSYSYWDASRVIPFTINEFPYWSFLFADLHPHLIGIPFTVLFLALAYSLLARQAHPATSVQAQGSRQLVAARWAKQALAGGLIPAMGLVLGALAVINTWDLPTYFGLAVLAWVLRDWRAGRFATAPGRALLRALAFAAGLLGMALLLYWPFFTHYEALASSGVGLVKDKTELAKWLNVWGLLGLLLGTYALVELRRRRLHSTLADNGLAGDQARDPALLRWVRLALDRFAQIARLVDLTPGISPYGLALAGLAAALTVVLWLLDWRVPAVLVFPLLGTGLLLWRRMVSPQRLFISILAFVALLVLLGVELVYLKDHLQGGDWRRMNTLFKFYIQVWVMLALAMGVALPGVWRFVHERWSRGWRILWTGTFLYLLALSLVFLVAGTPARLDDRFPPEMGRPAIGTLDGMAYMQAGTYNWHPDGQQAPNTPIDLRYDYEALRWLLDNASGTPVVAEALLGYYREGGLRAATFTGFPTLLGFHQEGEQRYSWQTGPRRAQAEEFWRTADAARGRQLIDELGIDYVYAGRLEQIVYPAEGLAKLQALVDSGDLEVVYANEQVTIYRVRH